MTNKYKLLECKLLEARKVKDDLTKNLLSVIKGEVESKSKERSNKLSKDELTESCVKILIKKLLASRVLSISTKVQSTLDKEITILKQFAPIEIPETKLIDIITKMNLSELPNFGARMGKAMKELKGKADGKTVKKILINLGLDEN